jgi:hypothetical protein
MREQWFADNRDLLKWGTVLELATRRKARSILQIAMLTDRTGEQPRPEITTVGSSFRVPDRVWRLFRSAASVRRLGSPELAVIFHDAPFTKASRAEYFRAVTTRLVKTNPPRIVLIDPDTGLAPRSATERHVMPSELAAVWKVLASGDWILLYQHARRSHTWQRETRAALARSLELQRSNVSVFKSEAVSDVIILGAEKPRRGVGRNRSTR